MIINNLDENKFRRKMGSEGVYCNILKDGQRRPRKVPIELTHDGRE